MMLAAPAVRADGALSTAARKPGRITSRRARRRSQENTMSWSIRRKLGAAPVAGTASADGQGANDHLLPTSRLEAFSDGVFAIAITLLVLELHVPTGHEALVKGLEHEWPRYLGYFVSFAFIGGVWVAHSTLTRFIKAKQGQDDHGDPVGPAGIGQVGHQDGAGERGAERGPQVGDAP
jgi:hypothetical protein